MAIKKHGRQYDIIVFGATGMLCLLDASMIEMLTNGATRLYRQIDGRAHCCSPPDGSEMGRCRALAGQAAGRSSAVRGRQRRPPTARYVGSATALVRRICCGESLFYHKLSKRT
jgi:hypothetical protein